MVANHHEKMSLFIEEVKEVQILAEYALNAAAQLVPDAWWIICQILRANSTLCAFDVLRALQARELGLAYEWKKAKAPQLWLIMGEVQQPIEEPKAANPVKDEAKMPVVSRLRRALNEAVVGRGLYLEGPAKVSLVLKGSNAINVAAVMKAEKAKLKK